jgi:hypothetical protein
MSFKKMISNNVHGSAAIVNSQSPPNLHKTTKHILNNLITVYFNKYLHIRIEPTLFCRSLRPPTTENQIYSTP